MTCKRSFYVEGSERPGTFPTIYDPANVMGGARYEECGKESVTRSTVSGVDLCAEHAKEEKDFLEASGPYCCQNEDDSHRPPEETVI